MEFEDRPQLPLTPTRKMLVAAGGAMFAGLLGAAAAVAPATTGPGDAHAGVLAAMWAASIPLCVGTVLLLVRQADLPDIATASFLVTISVFAAYALSAALALRGTGDEINTVDGLFLGVTGGGLTALLVWGIAMLVARMLRLPTTEGLDGGA
ncbi:MAG: hypothetical protein WEC75_10855 [Dehalococcoidia bacterium]